MNPTQNKRHDRTVKILLLLVSLATLILLVASALRENFFPEWRWTRLEYAQILQKAATDDRSRAIAKQFEIAIDQVVVPKLGAIDRCITCHTGLSDPRMRDEPNPFRTHPGTLLVDHPAEQFGCVVCHQGQGRATESEAAHGHEENWTTPMFEKDFAYSACTQCHEARELFDSPPFTSPVAEAEDSDESVKGARLLARGRRRFETAGCLGCHKFNDRGGALGPDITFVGDKSRHDFDFSHFAKDEPRTVTRWLERHFLQPAEISPGTVMPDLHLSPEDARALTAYVLTFHHRDLPRDYQVLPKAQLMAKTPLSGEEIYLRICSACHGADGRQSEVPGIRTPALNNPDLLAVASDDYLRRIIETGRQGTAMPAWGAQAGGLSHEEIDRVVAHLRSWEHEGADLDRVSSRAGDPSMGAAYFRGLCVNCHGNGGAGGLGNTLNSANFLGIASDRFLAETIVNGRPGTAMASWKHLPAQAISDLLAYIRSWEAAPPTFEQTRQILQSRPAQELIETGETLYRSKCAACHGPDGEGEIGPRIVGAGILPAVDNRFLFRTITEGRPTTAMAAWRHLSAEQVGALIAFLRSRTDEPPLDLPEPPAGGDYDIGEVQFKLACAQCHGEQGRGGVGPQLANPSFLSAVSDSTLYYWIAHGRTETAMKGFLPEEQGPLKLEPARIADVIAYLRHMATRPRREFKRSGEGDSVLGEQLYSANCTSCHGTQGQGASGPQLHNTTFLRSASDGFLAATIVLGRTGTAMESMIQSDRGPGPTASDPPSAEADVPGGVGQIDPKRVRDIVAYLRSWDFDTSWSKPRAIVEAKRRSIKSGWKKFGHYCAPCHGPNGRGVADGLDYFAPALNNREFLAAASDGFLQATIARGRSNTPMRPFGVGAGGIAPLRAGEINDIISYIRTWGMTHAPKGD